jgi:ferredoxin
VSVAGTATGLRVAVDPETCAVSSLCVYRAGAVFDQDAEGHVVLLDPHPPAALREEVRRAARSCPTRSIRVLEDGVQTAPDPADDPHH